MVVDGVSVPHYCIVHNSPVVDSAPVLDINFIMESITEVDVRLDVIDGCSISAFCEEW
jgi:hypothetical protein